MIQPSFKLEYPDPAGPVGATFTFSREQIAELLKRLAGKGHCAGAWCLLRDAGEDMSLRSDGYDF